MFSLSAASGAHPYPHLHPLSLIPSPRPAVKLLAFLLLITSIPPSAHSFHITKSITDSVSAGDVIHYTLSFTSPVVVIVVSQEGDVDLYASPTHKNSKPSSDNYDISSASCGLDVLSLIMSSEVRQYSLGVYGHVRYDESRFSLYVVQPSEEDIKSYQVIIVLLLLNMYNGIWNLGINPLIPPHATQWYS